MSSEAAKDTEVVDSPTTTLSSQDEASGEFEQRPPTLRSPMDGRAPSMTSSSTPLGPINAARRPGPMSARSSGLPSDLQAKMKAFSLSRQGAPPTIGRPGVPVPQQGTATNQSTSGLAGGAAAGVPGGGKMPQGPSRPNAPSFGSPPPPPNAPNGARVGGPAAGGMKLGGLAAKRGLKPGGMKLSDAQKPSENGENAQATDTGSQFGKFASIVDTQKGTLTFKNKAIVHGGGIDFSSGSTFSISLDEVDTIDELGKGNYGTVFKVRHARPKMRRPGQGLRGNMVRQTPSAVSLADDGSQSNGTTGLVMAMKEIRLELDDAKFAQIIMELDILHRCLSPFIIDFYGAFFQEGSVYICLEYMDGGSIDKLYGDGVPEGVLRKITLSTIMGLKYLKDEHNIIHRDVKPTNVLVNSKGQVKICDFGVSGNLVASMARTNIGCQSYMAPERISGGGMSQAGANPAVGSYSVQSDIWSLGLSIIECALGRYPYPPETYDNIFSQLSAIVDGEPPDLPADRFSEAARDFVRGCLNKVPKMRPTYAALLRHSWLSPLMQPPTIAEDEEAEKLAEAGADTFTSAEPVPETADKEIAEWVATALEKKKAGKLATSAKPALHAAPLDAVPGSPLIDEQMVDVKPVLPNPGIPVNSPELIGAKIHPLDFASGVGNGNNNR